MARGYSTPGVTHAEADNRVIAARFAANTHSVTTPSLRGRMKRVTGFGGIFLKANDAPALQAWYKRHLGIDVQEWQTSLQYRRVAVFLDVEGNRWDLPGPGPAVPSSSNARRY